jgi:hypothetical protein
MSEAILSPSAIISRCGRSDAGALVEELELDPGEMVPLGEVDP